MTPTARECLAFVEWQGLSTYETKRGKAKPIVTGLPSPMFWRRWKTHAREIRAGFLSLRKLGAWDAKNGQWEVIAWVNPETLPELTALGLVPVESAGPSDPIPAGTDPF
jgi:hypothetical protein